MTISIIFYGTPAYAAPTLETLLFMDGVSVKAVVTQPDKPAGRGKSLQSSPIKTLATKHGIPVLQPPSIRKDEPKFLSDASAFGPFDLGVVVAFGQILPLATLKLPASGSVNIHASLLPRWRGAAPIQRAIIEGDTKTGVCLMAMEEGLDTGAVFARSELSIEPTDTFGSLHDKLSPLGASLLREHLNAIVCGAIVPEPQSSQGVSYAKRIMPEEAAIDWSLPAAKLSCLIRGLSPFPGAFSFIRDQRVRILMATQGSGLGEVSGTPPGTVVFVDKYRLEVQCGQGTLLLQELQLEGKRRLPVVDFLNGCKPEVGGCFGK